MKFANLNIISITAIQLTTSTVISLIFQFIIPYSWQPLDTFLHGAKKHGDPGTNIVIFTISQWYFSLSVPWFLYHKNLYINNFLIYSILPLSYIVSYEFLFLNLYYDYIHVTPLVIDFYLLWNRRKYLSQKLAPYIITMNVIWLITVYVLKLAYYNEELLIFLRNLVIYLIFWIGLSFLFKSKESDSIEVL